MLQILHVARVQTTPTSNDGWVCKDCESAIRPVMGNFWSVREDDSALVCTFPCSWRPNTRTVDPFEDPPMRTLTIRDVPSGGLALGCDAAHSQTPSHPMPSADSIASALVARWNLICSRCSISKSESARGGKRSGGWTPESIEKLGALPGSREESDHLTVILEVITLGSKSSQCEQKLRATKEWLGVRALPIRTLSREVACDEGKEDFVLFLSACTRISNLHTALHFLVSSRNVCDCSEKGWDAEAITEWVNTTMTLHTPPWSLEDSIEMFTIAVASEYPANRALKIAAVDLSSSPVAWRDLWVAHCIEATEDPSENDDCACQDQLEAPKVGEDRWHDSQDHPEHAALLLDHALRDFIGSLFYLWCAPSNDGFAGAVGMDLPGALRGDAQFLHQENGLWSISRDNLRSRARELLSLELGDSSVHLTEALVDKLDDLLRNGAASTTPFTGECLPRRVVWEVGG